jgi:protease IV
MSSYKSVLLFIFLSGVISAQNTFPGYEEFSSRQYPSYYYQNEFALTSAGAMRYGLYGADNPALLTTLSGPDLLFTWSDQEGWESLNRWGLFAAVPNFSFNVNRENYLDLSVTDYKLNLAMGNMGFGLGFGYGWSTGNEGPFNRSNVFTAGTFFRPFRYISVGIVGNFPANGINEGIIDLAFRPLGNEFFSVFGDYVFRKGITSEHTRWSAGAAFEIIPGIRLTGRYFDKELFTVGIEYSLGGLGLSSQARFSSDGHMYNTYGIRAGAYDRNMFAYLNKDNSIVEMDLKGGLKYQRFRFLDNSNTLKDILGYIKSAGNDKSSSGVVLNLSGMLINREMVWEIRKELQLLKEKGKRIYIYFDRLDMNGYHLASVADKIVMDPIGNVSLEGYVAGRTYFTGTLEKIGIGFNELRNFRYKSAYESFTREEMSEADEEQLQAIVDDYYELARNEIRITRGFSETQFDSIVNNTPFFFPDEAVEIGLADTVARWDKMHDIINKWENDSKRYISPSSLSRYRDPEDNYWGEKPKIAVVYALGVCAMDEGINARQLVKQLESVLKSNRVKAVVLRVDSPGGDALASDLISEKIKEYKYRKPVIISQGYVAASGGYWLSMYGDTIVAAPNTITGSIGVIGAWVYNKDLKEKLGVSTDYVKRGTHADLPFGMRFPFIGMSLPDRDLSKTEEERFRNGIDKSYRTFLNKVSEGREMTYDEVHEVAQGRVWSGQDGTTIGLIDVVGNLNTAIEIAAERSGLKYDEYDLIELPEPGLFDFNMFVPRLAGIKINTEDPFIQHLKFRIDNMGTPMPLLPLEFTSGVLVQY